MTELLAVVAITFFAVISPGPDFAMVSRNSLLLSRRTGVLTALGIAAGVCIHEFRPIRERSPTHPWALRSVRGGRRADGSA